MLMDVVAIQKLLPHRYPFLMVDGILERMKHVMGANTRVVATGGQATLIAVAISFSSASQQQRTSTPWSLATTVAPISSMSQGRAMALRRHRESTCIGDSGGSS